MQIILSINIGLIIKFSSIVIQSKLSECSMSYLLNFIVMQNLKIEYYFYSKNHFDMLNLFLNTLDLICLNSNHRNIELKKEKKKEIKKSMGNHEYF